MIKKLTPALLLLAFPLMATSTNTKTDSIRTDWPDLPEPVSNNAVAAVNLPEGTALVSMMGLGAKKDWRAVHNKVWVLMPDSKSWQQRTPVPSSYKLSGRLASTAVSVNGQVYVFGGYTVAEDHSEISVPDVYRYDIKKDTYTRLANMPVPVDDSVALVYQDRYIYLVSGWHNDGNVNLTQIYDTKTDRWQQASPFPGKPVFGQAGALSGNRIVICDGVGVDYYPDKRRGFSAATQCFYGDINKDSPTKIDWRTLKHPTGVARYRMAATAVNDTFVFAAGSDNPYNYNGIGYNGVPSPASAALWLLDSQSLTWTIMKGNAEKTMDHRGLLSVDGQLITVGGMDNNQKVLQKVIPRKIAH